MIKVLSHEFFEKSMLDVVGEASESTSVTYDHRIFCRVTIQQFKFKYLLLQSTGGLAVLWRLGDISRLFGRQFHEN